MGWGPTFWSTSDELTGCNFKLISGTMPSISQVYNLHHWSFKAAAMETLGFPWGSLFATASRAAFARNNRNTFLKRRRASFPLFREPLKNESSILKMDI